MPEQARGGSRAPVLVALIVLAFLAGGAAAWTWSRAQAEAALREQAIGLAAMLNKSPELDRTQRLLEALAADAERTGRPVEAFIVAGQENVRASSREAEKGQDWPVVRARLEDKWGGVSLVKVPLFRDPSAPEKNTGDLYVAARPADARLPAMVFGGLCAMLTLIAGLVSGRGATVPTTGPVVPAGDDPVDAAATALTLQPAAEVPAREEPVAVERGPEVMAQDPDPTPSSHEEPRAPQPAPTYHPADGKGASVQHDTRELPRARADALRDTRVLGKQQSEALRGQALSAHRPPVERIEASYPAPGAEEPASPPDARDRRRFPRYECALTVRYDLTLEGTSIRGEGTLDALNVSVGGLKIRARHKLALGNMLTVHLPLPDGILSARARVVWRSPKGPEAGIEFVGMSDEDCSRLLEALETEGFPPSPFLE